MTPTERARIDAERSRRERLGLGYQDATASCGRCGRTFDVSAELRTAVLAYHVRAEHPRFATARVAFGGR